MKKQPSTPNVTEGTPTDYFVHNVIGDGDCGYTSFGITRKDALRLLKENILLIRDFITLAVKEALITDAFFNYLCKEKIITGDTTLKYIENNLEKYANNLNIQLAYLKYDVEEKLFDFGWAHPAILQALAVIQNIELNLWQLDRNHKLIPHSAYEGRYAHYTPKQGNPDGSIDLLFVDGNHFNRIDIFNKRSIYTKNIIISKPTSSTPKIIIPSSEENKSTPPIPIPKPPGTITPNPTTDTTPQDTPKYVESPTSNSSNSSVGSNTGENTSFRVQSSHTASFLSLLKRKPSDSPIKKVEKIEEESPQAKYLTSLIEHQKKRAHLKILNLDNIRNSEKLILKNRIAEIEEELTELNTSIETNIHNKTEEIKQLTDKIKTAPISAQEELENTLKIKGNELLDLYNDKNKKDQDDRIENLKKEQLKLIEQLEKTEIQYCEKINEEKSNTVLFSFQKLARSFSRSLKDEIVEENQDIKTLISHCQKAFWNLNNDIQENDEAISAYLKEINRIAHISDKKEMSKACRKFYEKLDLFFMKDSLSPGLVTLLGEDCVNALYKKYTPQAVRNFIKSNIIEILVKKQFITCLQPETLKESTNKKLRESREAKKQEILDNLKKNPQNSSKKEDELIKQAEEEEKRLLEKEIIDNFYEKLAREARKSKLNSEMSQKKELEKNLKIETNAETRNKLQTQLNNLVCVKIEKRNSIIQNLKQNNIESQKKPLTSVFEQFISTLSLPDDKKNILKDMASKLLNEKNVTQRERLAKELEESIPLFILSETEENDLLKTAKSQWSSSLKEKEQNRIKNLYSNLPSELKKSADHVKDLNSLYQEVDNLLSTAQENQRNLGPSTERDKQNLLTKKISELIYLKERINDELKKSNDSLYLPSDQTLHELNVQTHSHHSLTYQKQLYTTKFHSLITEYLKKNKQKTEEFYTSIQALVHSIKKYKGLCNAELADLKEIEKLAKKCDGLIKDIFSPDETITKYLSQLQTFISPIEKIKTRSLQIKKVHDNAQKLNEKNIQIRNNLKKPDQKTTIEKDKERQILEIQNSRKILDYKTTIEKDRENIKNISQQFDEIFLEHRTYIKKEIEELFSPNKKWDIEERKILIPIIKRYIFKIILNIIPSTEKELLRQHLDEYQESFILRTFLRAEGIGENLKALFTDPLEEKVAKEKDHHLKQEFFNLLLDFQSVEESTTYHDICDLLSIDMAQKKFHSLLKISDLAAKIEATKKVIKEKSSELENKTTHFRETYSKLPSCADLLKKSDALLKQSREKTETLNSSYSLDALNKQLAELNEHILNISEHNIAITENQAFLEKIGKELANIDFGLLEDSDPKRINFLNGCLKLFFEELYNSSETDLSQNSFDSFDGLSLIFKLFHTQFNTLLFHMKNSKSEGPKRGQIKDVVIECLQLNTAYQEAEDKNLFNQCIRYFFSNKLLMNVCNNVDKIKCPDEKRREAAKEKVRTYLNYLSLNARTILYFRSYLNIVSDICPIQNVEVHVQRKQYSEEIVALLEKTKNPYFYLSEEDCENIKNSLMEGAIFPWICLAEAYINLEEKISDLKDAYDKKFKNKKLDTEEKEFFIEMLSFLDNECKSKQILTELEKDYKKPEEKLIFIIKMRRYKVDAYLEFIKNYTPGNARKKLDDLLKTHKEAVLGKDKKDAIPLKKEIEELFKCITFITKKYNITQSTEELTKISDAFSAILKTDDKCFPDAYKELETIHDEIHNIYDQYFQPKKSAIRKGLDELSSHNANISQELQHRIKQAGQKLENYRSSNTLKEDKEILEYGENELSLCEQYIDFENKLEKNIGRLAESKTTLADIISIKDKYTYELTSKLLNNHKTDLYLEYLYSRSSACIILSQATELLLLCSKKKAQEALKIFTGEEEKKYLYGKDDLKLICVHASKVSSKKDYEKIERAWNNWKTTYSFILKEENATSVFDEFNLKVKNIIGTILKNDKTNTYTKSFEKWNDNYQKTYRNMCELTHLSAFYKETHAFLDSLKPFIEKNKLITDEFISLTIEVQFKTICAKISQEIQEQTKGKEFKERNPNDIWVEFLKGYLNAWKNPEKLKDFCGNSLGLLKTIDKGLYASNQRSFFYSTTLENIMTEIEKNLKPQVAFIAKLVPPLGSNNNRSFTLGNQKK